MLLLLLRLLLLLLLLLSLPTKEVSVGDCGIPEASSRLGSEGRRRGLGQRPFWD